MAQPLGIATIVQFVVSGNVIAVAASAVGIWSNCCLLLLTGNTVVGMEQGIRRKSADV